MPPCGGTKGGCGWLLPMKVEGMVFVCPIWHGRLALVGSLVCLMYPSYSSPLTGARWFLANYQIPRGAAAGACDMDDVTLGVLGESHYIGGFPQISISGYSQYLLDYPYNAIGGIPIVCASRPQGRERTMKKPRMSLVIIPLQSIGYYFCCLLGIPLCSPLDISLCSSSDNPFAVRWLSPFPQLLSLSHNRQRPSFPIKQHAFQSTSKGFVHTVCSTDMQHTDKAEWPSG